MKDRFGGLVAGVEVNGAHTREEVASCLEENYPEETSHTWAHPSANHSGENLTACGARMLDGEGNIGILDHC